MSELAIRAALEKRLNTISTGFATQFENAPLAPAQGAPYQQVALEASDPENPSIGASLHRAIGLFRVSLFYPINAGAAPAWTRALLIRSTFPRGLTLTEQGVTTHIDATPSISRSDGPADRYCLVVRIRYHADIFS
ncbi:MAG TPA: phage tail terminator-like protein [Methylibium sp.]|nr:phage tail terminator-like protein [Methylibium sp.]